MNLAIILSRAIQGMDAPQVTVETHLSNGLPSLSIVGLPEAAVRESKDRVRSAILNSGFEFPTRRITINLAPADLPKTGGRFDLPIALSILAASGQINPKELSHYEFVGELALTGALRSVDGILPCSIQCLRANRNLVLPNSNTSEASLAEGLTLFGANSLLEVCGHLSGEKLIEPTTSNLPCAHQLEPSHSLSLDDVKGQLAAKRALMIAAGGGHNLLMIGPPGTGKTMLARRLPTLLPPLNTEEALDTASILSISHQGFEAKEWRKRPFRDPHHTASATALVGGGSHPKPGEISLAHNGVLFLDELPLFERRVLEVLREPLEEGAITLSRATQQVSYPARFQLVAAMNPSPSGSWADAQGSHEHSPQAIRRYLNKLSGPFLDRIDMHIEVTRNTAELVGTLKEKQRLSAEAAKTAVAQCRQRQTDRQGKTNAALNSMEIDRYCQLNSTNQALIQNVIEKLELSGRAFHRILKVARTLADLDGRAEINKKDLLEAVGYRRLERLQKAMA